jgi:murein lipoprotein
MSQLLPWKGKPIERRQEMMKKFLLMTTVMLALAFTVGGCATRSDLQDMQAREMAISAKADQAAQDAEAAKAAADEALMKANEATMRAEAAEKRAEERERIAAEKERAAEEKMKQADAIFQKSMKK